MQVQLNATEDFRFIQFERSNYFDFRFKITDSQFSAGCIHQKFPGGFHARNSAIALSARSCLANSPWLVFCALPMLCAWRCWASF